MWLGAALFTSKKRILQEHEIQTHRHTSAGKACSPVSVYSIWTQGGSRESFNSTITDRKLMSKNNWRCTFDPLWASFVSVPHPSQLEMSPAPWSSNLQLLSDYCCLFPEHLWPLSLCRTEQPVIWHKIKSESVPPRLLSSLTETVLHFAAGQRVPWCGYKCLLYPRNECKASPRKRPVQSEWMQQSRLFEFNSYDVMRMSVVLHITFSLNGFYPVTLASIQDPDSEAGSTETEVSKVRDYYSVFLE